MASTYTDVIVLDSIIGIYDTATRIDIREGPLMRDASVVTGNTLRAVTVEVTDEAADGNVIQAIAKREPLLAAYIAEKAARRLGQAALSGPAPEIVQGVLREVANLLGRPPRRHHPPQARSRCGAARWVQRLGRRDERDGYEENEDAHRRRSARRSPHQPVRARRRTSGTWRLGPQVALTSL